MCKISPFFTFFFFDNFILYLNILSNYLLQSTVYSSANSVSRRTEITAFFHGRQWLTLDVNNVDAVSASAWLGPVWSGLGQPSTSVQFKSHTLLWILCKLGAVTEFVARTKAFSWICSGQCYVSGWFLLSCWVDQLKFLDSKFSH